MTLATSLVRLALAAMAFATGLAVPAAAQQLYAIGNASQVIVVDLASRVQNGTTLRLKFGLVRKTPVRLDGVDYYWTDGLVDIACLEHQTRAEPLAGLTLDRSSRHVQTTPVFSAWADNTPGSEGKAVEDFVCHGLGREAFAPVNSLVDLGRRFVKGGPAQVAAPPATHPPSGLAPYYLAGNSGTVAILIDMAHVTRNKDHVTTALMALAASPINQQGAAFYWTHLVDEYDCARHRYRESLRELLTLDLQTASPSPELSFGPWADDKPDTMERDIEVLVCTGKVQPGQTAVQDLTAFQQQFFATKAR